MDLEEIGNFSVDSNFVLPPEADKSAFFPLEGIRFTYNRHAQTTPELLDFIIAQTGKIRSLVTADFESYLSEIRQFVNLGKPWVIDGIGTIQKTKEGTYELIPGQVTSERISTQFTMPEELEDNETSRVKMRNWFVTFLLTMSILLVLAGLGFGIYTLFIKPTPMVTTQDIPSSDTSVGITDTPSATDTSSPDIHRQTTDTASHAADTVRYKAIFSITKWRHKAFRKLNYWNKAGFPAFMDSTIIADTLRYRIFIYKRSLPADTNNAKEQLSKVFGTKILLEPKF